MASKVYGFCVEPMAFNPVAKRIDQLAIERKTSRSEVIADILFAYFGMENTNINRDRKILNRTETLMKRINS